MYALALPKCFFLSYDVSISDTFKNAPIVLPLNIIVSLNIFMTELSKQNKFWIGVVVGNTANLANTNSANRKQEDVVLVMEQQNI